MQLPTDMHNFEKYSTQSTKDMCVASIRTYMKFKLSYTILYIYARTFIQELHAYVHLHRCVFEITDNKFSSLATCMSRIGIHDHFITCTIGWIWLQLQIILTNSVAT